ncbi:YceI family protein [Moraxella canis]|uniref:YceI family protein n=1 Tax=Moraxella canis TaxID=90239 RepID=A0ABZ0WX46_9GAMM|nr:YceI family protein [Moraxella canis]WQE03735.1 YceI family protein [Moraxella canis]
MKKLSLIALLAVAGFANAATYELDPYHTNARFSIDHFGTSTNMAGFYELSGVMQFDRAAGTGSIDISIPVGSLKAPSSLFTQHLKAANLFNVEQHPTMRFVSNQFYFTGTGANRKLQSVSGNLTLLGQTHPVTLTATKFNCYNSPILNAEVCGGDFTATVDRTKWGMNYLVDVGIPKDVRIDIQVEASKKGN